MAAKDWIGFAMSFTLRERRRTSDSALSRARSKVLRRHPRRLASEALRLLQRWGKESKYYLFDWLPIEKHGPLVENIVANCG